MISYKYHVDERIFMLDCARKYFTPSWFKRLIDDISAVGYNALTVHFSEDIAHRLESKRYPWLAGGDHTLCVYGVANGIATDDDKIITQDQMREIVEYAHSRGIEVIPSMDSPGHMNYAVKKYNEHYSTDIGNYFHKHGTISIVHGSSVNKEREQLDYSRGIDITNPEAVEFVKSLYMEYGLFFRELGCKSFDIGGDELLGFGEVIDGDLTKWENLDHWQEHAKTLTGRDDAVAYDAFILYMNDIATQLRSIGYESIRMWNDDVYRFHDTGWHEAAKLDKSIDIQYWSDLNKNTAEFYVERGHRVYNFARRYTYYTMHPSQAPSLVTPEIITDEWSPYVFGTSTKENVITPPNEMVKGAGFCLWTDTPAAQTEDELIENIKPYYTALIEKMKA